ncbi:hypothetical protein CCUS01_08772 [Colletotrichum cuscutae]|uniref:ATPase inhibitor, mitochondrial n=1 Tax=Colletotrichum cuscutae TaxID=1209917 RepID=A0AAI9ULF7_9PEZI|nr:hypothetical protein CCUS01_08772 [Colletotrichum cuscutae]
MMRIAATKAAARPLTLASRACFSTTARTMSEGDTGAPSKYGGGDAFQKREKANEDYAIRQREKEKLLELKKKLSEQQAHLQQLSDHMFVHHLSSFHAFPSFPPSKPAPSACNDVDFVHLLTTAPKTVTRSPKTRVASTTKFKIIKMQFPPRFTEEVFSKR